MRLNTGVFGKWRFAGPVMLALLISFSGAAFGQSTGTLTGTVTDPKGLAMGNATVLVHSEDTGLDQRPVTTTDAGIYVVPLLPPGNYDITVSQAGFATVQHKDVTLQVGQTIRIDFEMPVAAQQSLVTVTTEAPILETEKTDQAQNVSENLVSNLPVSSRRWEQFALLTPGVTTDGAAGAVSFHGISSMYNNNSVDGANNNTMYDQTTRGGYNAGYVYSSDTIREFQVESSGFNAELGQAAGASVNAVTKSGSSTYHGDLFYNGRTPSLNAYDPVGKAFAAVNGTTPAQPVKQQNQFGGALGGPLKKDRLFFFAAFDGFRRVNPLTVTPAQLTPSIPAMVCPNPGLVSAADCAAAKSYILNHFLGVFPEELWQDIELVKLDYQINQSNHVNAVTNVRDYELPIPDSLQNNSNGSFIQDRFTIATLNTVIGSNKVNEFRYQWGLDNVINPKNTAIGAPGVTLTGLFTYGNEDGEAFQRETRNQLTDNFSLTKGTHTIKFGVDMNFIVDFVRGSINSLGPYTYSGYSFPSTAAGATGAANFAPCPLPGSASATANAEFCDWLIDAYGANLGDGATGQHFTSYQQFHDTIFNSPPNSFEYNMPTQDYAGYVQDTWKARPNLTVNYGLRYDVQALPHLPNSVSEICATVDPAACAGGPGDLPILDYYTTNYPTEYDGFQPRLGVAWNFRKSTVLRVGGGEFFAKSDGHNLKNVFSGAGEATVSCQAPETAANCPTTAAGNLVFPNLFFDQQNISPAGIPLPGAVAPEVTAPSNISIPNSKFGIRGVDPDFKRPRAWEFETAIEQQLPGNMNLSVSYVFTRGNHLPRGGDGNLGSNVDANACTGTTANTCDVPITKTYDVVDTSGNTVLQTTVPIFFQRVAPLTGPIPRNVSDVNTMYNGLVVTLRKPLSHGIEILANYTYSKATDDGEQGSNNSGGTSSFTGLEGQVGEAPLNPFNTKLEQGLSTTDVPNRFTTSVVYAPSFGTNSANKLVKGFAGGWSLSGTFVAQDGTHYEGTVNSTKSPSVTYAAGTLFNTSGVALTGSALTFTGLDGGMTGALISSPGANVAGRLYWIPRNFYELPNLYDVDVRLTKDITVKERFHIAIRGEAFNLINSTLVQGVNTVAYAYANPGAAGCVGHTNTCMIPQSSFQQANTTTNTSGLLGPRQLQAGLRFEF
jgi:hypothetical protein